jgi:enoyl-CoA hydratase
MQSSEEAMGRINLDIRQGVAMLEVDAPDLRNALSIDMAREMVARCDEIDTDPTIGAAVIYGAGGTFCSGAERGFLSSVGRAPLAEDNYANLGAIYRAFIRFGELAVPTVAAVRGAVVGAGLNLMLAADLRIIATDARIMSGFLRIGLHPGGGHFGLLAHRAGGECAAALGLFGLEIGAARAVELGLAWEVRPSEEVEPRAIDIATNAARDPALSRLALASMRAELGPPALPSPAAVAVERGPQLWSMARRAAADSV